MPAPFKRKLKSGRVAWGYNLYLGKDEAGKPIRKFKSGIATKGEAEKQMRQALNEADEYDPTTKPRTLQELLQEWIEDHASQHCSPKTVERYCAYVAYLHPDFLKIPISELGAQAIERECVRLKMRGGRHRKTKAPRPLSGRTVRHIMAVVSPALNRAVVEANQIESYGFL